MWFRKKKKRTKKIGEAQKVEITVSRGEISVSPDPVEVSKEKLEELVWKFKGKQDLFVDIHEPIFLHGSHFDKVKVRSGPVLFDVEAGREVKYTVTVGDLFYDPHIIVR